jgi:hypothetical protein
MKNAYSNKYESSAANVTSTASVSVAACDRAISIISEAKRAQQGGDKIGWIENLNKVHNELTILMESIGNDPEFESEKNQKLEYYFFLSLKTGLSKMEFSHPDRANQLIAKFQETRDFWIEAGKVSKNVPDSKPNDLI